MDDQPLTSTSGESADARRRSMLDPEGLAEPPLLLAEAPKRSSAPTWRIVLFLAWPVWLQQLLILAVGLSDRYLAGHTTPEEGGQLVAYQAAQTNANYL